MRYSVFAGAIILVLAACCSAKSHGIYRIDKEPQQRPMQGNGLSAEQTMLIAKARSVQQFIADLYHDVVLYYDTLREAFVETRTNAVTSRNQELHDVPGFWRNVMLHHPAFYHIAVALADEKHKQRLAESPEGVRC